MEKSLNVSAIVLAAGLSSRMNGDNKLLLGWKEKKIIEHTVNHLLEANLKEVIVVLGNDADEMRTHLNGFGDQIQIVLNEEFQRGMTSSIQTGIKCTDKISAGFMICHGDMCLIKGEEYNALAKHHLKEFKKNSDTITMPNIEGKFGNPIVFSQGYKFDILSHDEPNGCKSIVGSNKANVSFFESDSTHFTTDIDTWEDYFRIKAKNP